MTVRLSPLKVRKMLRYYFKGVSQNNIAKKSAVDQSTVSIYSSRFEENAGEDGLLAAARRYGVFEEVKELRSLAVELMKANLILEDAKEGVRIIKQFEKLGVSPDKHTLLIKVCARVEEPEFIDAAMRLIRIENEAGISYEKAISRFEKATRRLQVMENRLKKKKTRLESLDNTVSNRQQEADALRDKITQMKNEKEVIKHKLEREICTLELRKAEREEGYEARLEEIQAEAMARKAELDRELEAKLERMYKKAKAEQDKLDQELKTRMKQLVVKQEELEEVAGLKDILKKQGLDLNTMVELAKEFSYGKAKS